MDRCGSDFWFEFIEGFVYFMQEYEFQDDVDSLYSGDYGWRDFRF